MPLNALTIWLIFAVSLVVALARGVRPVYTWIYLPVLILLYQVPPVILTHVPIEASYAPLYACLIAIPFRQESVRFKPGLLDLVILLLLVSVALTALTTDGFEVAVNAFRGDLLRLALPYFLARISFKDWQPRRSAVFALAGVMAIVGFVALIEFRLSPLFYQHQLQSMGMNNIVLPDHLTRFGFNRVTGTVDQPIYFGNMCLVVAGMVAVLARTSGMRLRNPLVAATLLTTLMCVGLSLSFTPLAGLAAGTFGLVVLMTFPVARKFVLPVTIASIIGGFAYTYAIAHDASAGADKGDTVFDASYNIRNKIIRECWPVALNAGPFGRGLHPEFLDIDDFDLVSVDNTYLYFTMTRGWAYTTLWLSIAVIFAARVGRALRRANEQAQLLPLSICAATVLALMVSMYTVFAGALYTIVWMVMLGLSNTLIDTVNAAADAREGIARPAVGRLRPPTVRLPAVTAVAAR